MRRDWRLAIGDWSCRAVLLALVAFSATSSVHAQQSIVFKSDLPRTLVFINEEGGSGTIRCRIAFPARLVA